tara:strand:+ start:1041 stop:1400 length:360 start_codon:yes stop_codon:yes gene_type:complete
MNIIIVRPALFYGRLVKGKLKNMIRVIDKGWFPPFIETKNKMSITHVDDVVSAILFLNDKKNLKGNIFTVTYGKFYSSVEMYGILCTVLGNLSKWRVLKLSFNFILFFFLLQELKLKNF